MVRRVRENLLSSPILDIARGYLHFAVSRGSLEMADCAGYRRGGAENPFTSYPVGAQPTAAESRRMTSAATSLTAATLLTSPDARLVGAGQPPGTPPGVPA